MADALAISDIALSPRRRGLPEPIYGHREIWFDASFTVTNRSKEPLHVISQLRSYAYDGAARTLTLRLGEVKPGPLAGDAPSFTLPTPPTITLKPGATARLSVPVPAVMKEMQPGDGMAPAMRETDLRAMRTLRVEVAASAKPIGAALVLPAPDMRKRLAKWGKSFSSEAAVTPDTRD